MVQRLEAYGCLRMPKDAYNIDSIVFRKMNQMVRLLRQDL